MQRLIILIFCFYSASIFAQSTFGNFVDTTVDVNHLVFTGNFDLLSTSMKNEMVNTFLRGGTITSEMKDRSLKSHKGINRIGLFGNAEINYVHGSGQLGKFSKYTWQVKGGYYALGSANYSKDAYRLLLYGNAHLPNDSAKFSGTRLNMMQFQKIGFGVVHKKSGSSLTLNLVNVQNAYSGYIKEGLFNQDPTATNLYATLDGSAAFSKGKQFSKGIGFAFDFDLNFKVPWGKDSAIFKASIQNLGGAYLFVPQTLYAVDSNYHFDGFTFDQLRNGSLTGSDFSLLDTLNIHQSTKNKWVLLPMHFHIMKQVNLASAKKLQTFFGVRFYPTMGLIPSVYAGLFYRFIPQMSASVNAAYGGATIFRAGLFLGYHGKKIGVQIGTDDVYGMVSKRGYGQTGLIRFSWKF